ncbi:MAG: membrane lipoprotein lipid attachment site-containing protein [Bacteroidales bacterium]|nr:membrane lipoprotein lipid attachment site-containing protein [Bacteroidales bacterium]
MKKILFAIVFCLILTACGKDQPVKVPSNEIEEIEPNTEDRIEVMLSGYSNLTDYINVLYAIEGLDGTTETGSFKNFPTYRSWPKQEGTIRVAVFAEKIADFPASLFSSPDGITFGVVSQVNTPDDGKGITWCGLKNSKFKNSDELYNSTIKALNEGVTGGFSGTGKSKHLLYTVKKDNSGRYMLNLDFNSGNIFE